MGTKAEPPQDFPKYSGIIRDEELKQAIAQDMLLRRETADLARVRQTSYELRLSAQVEYLELRDENGRATAQYTRPANGIEQTLCINPSQTVKVWTQEQFNLPNDVVAHITPVGNIYKLGLSPETTYADPGFSGAFYIILSNFSPRVVELRVGQPIARAEFTKLAKPTPSPHPGAGQTSEPPIWPRRVGRRGVEELRALGVDGVLTELDAQDPPHCENAFVTREVRTQLAAEQARFDADYNQHKKMVEALLQRVDKLEQRDALSSKRLKFVLFIAVALVVLWQSPNWWPLLPDNVKKAIPEGLGKGLGAFIGGLIATLLTWLYGRLFPKKGS